jgi:hypothetical protein
MKTQTRWIAVALVLSALIPATAHAQIEVTGGGWIPGSQGDGSKATFGFDVASDASGSATGDIVYHDRTFQNSAFPKGVNIHATPTFVFGFTPGGVEVLGTYEAAQRGTSGDFVARFIDTGQDGPSKGDSFEITLFDGSTPLYTNSGVLGGGGPGGGNITVTGPSLVSLLVLLVLLRGWATLQRRLWRPGCAR